MYFDGFHGSLRPIQRRHDETGQHESGFDEKRRLDEKRFHEEGRHQEKQEDEEERRNEERRRHEARRHEERRLHEERRHEERRLHEERPAEAELSRHPASSIPVIPSEAGTLVLASTGTSLPPARTKIFALLGLRNFCNRQESTPTEPLRCPILLTPSSTNHFVLIFLSIGARIIRLRPPRQCRLQILPQAARARNIPILHSF